MTYKERKARALLRANEKFKGAGAPKKEDEKSIFHTAIDFLTRVPEGVSNSLEGIVDYVAGLGGEVAGIFSDDAKAAVRKFIERDTVKSPVNLLPGNMGTFLKPAGDAVNVTSQVAGLFSDEAEKNVRKYTGVNALENAYSGMEKSVSEKSYLYGNEVGEFVGGVAEGVGGMLPAVLVTAATGGAGAPAAAASIAGTTTTGLGAAGQSMEQALRDGAGYEQSLLYGAGSGLVEGATEQIGGFVFGKGASRLGKAISSSPAGKVASSRIGKFVLDAATEGGEEVLADLADPALRYVTGVDKNISQNYAEALKAENLGRTFAAGAAVGSVMQGGQNILRNSSNKSRGGAHATRADDALRNVIKATEKYNGAANNDFKYDKTVKYNLESMAKELGKMSPEARKNYLDSIGIYKNAFDRETGKLKENSMPYAHREAITANLRTFSGNLSHKPLTGGENITNGAKTAKKTVERVVGHGAAVVVTNELGAEDRAIYNPDDGVIYINNNADLTEKDVANAVALHEVTHTTEGTKAYTKLVEQIEAIANDKNAPESVKKIVGDITLRRYSTATSYEAEMEGLSKEQSRYLVDTEVSADLIGDLLSNDYFIEKLAERDMGLLQKLYHSFKNRANAKKSELGPDGIKYLKKLASKFGTAIEKRAGGVKISQIGDEDEEKKEKLSTSETNVRFSKKQIPGTNEYFALIEKESIDKLNQYPGDSLAAKVRNYLKQFRGTVLPLGDAKKAFMRREAEGEYTNPAKSISPDDYSNKLNAASEIVNLLSCAEFSHHEADNGRHPDAVRGWDYYSIIYVVPDKQENLHAYKGEIQIKLIGRGDCFYDITKIEDITSGTAGQTLIKAAGSAQISSDNSISENEEKINSSDERSSKNRSYDPKNGKEPTFEAVPGGVKINFNDFDTNKSNDNSNDLVSKGSSDRENEAWGYEAAEKARRESLDSLLEGKDAPRRSPVSVDNNLLRRVVDNTKAKKYTRKEIKTIVDELLSSEGYFGDNTVVMKGKKRAELEKMLWQALNTKGKGELGGAALDAAEYIIQNAIAVEYLEVTDDIQLAVQFVDALKPYLHNMNLDFIKGDIKAKFDKDKTPYLMWAVKKDSSFRGYTADEVAGELEALGFRIDKTNEADIFLEINELYRLAKQTITDAVPTKDTLLNALGTKKAKELKQALVKDILIAQEEKGTETSFYKLQQKYIKQIAELGEKVKTAHKRNTLENRILKEAKTIYDSNKHTFANATEVQTEALKNIKSLLSRVNSREQVNRSSLRAIMKELAIWYSEKNPVLEGFYDNYIAEHLAYFAETVGEDADVRDAEGVVPYEVVQKMDSVKTVTDEEFAKGETDLVTQVENYFKSLGSKVTNEELGEVLIDKRGIKDDIAHGIGRKKAATFAAVPDVIQKGKVVDYQKNWKGRNYDTAVIAAPITVGTEKHYMGVVVIQNKENNRFYVHEVVEIKNEGAQPFKTGPVEKNSNAGGDAPSVISILQKIANYNRESENSQNVKREKPLSMSELEMVQIILHHMNHVFENFGKMWRGGKYVEASDVAEEQHKVLVEAEKNHSSFEKAILHNKALRYIMDPMAVLAAWDGHDPNGYFTTTYKEFAEGLIGQRWDEMRALEEFDEFRKTHKKYFKTLTNGNDKIKVSGRIDPRNLTVSEIEIPKNVAIDLYMVSKTGQAIVTLEEVGYKVRIDGQHEQETMQTINKAQIEEMYKRFSEEDKELISIMERAYNG